MRRVLPALLAAFALVLAALAGAAPATAHSSSLRPIIFVHGSAGSANQFQTPAQRFSSNGYPADYIDAVEYDSQFQSASMAEVHERIDAKVTELLRRTGAKQVELVGHSLGTFVSQEYLTSSPERAARVAHYVNIDGRTADAPPGGVDTLALWAEQWRDPDQARQIVGAKNVGLGDQGHTEAVTSPESFAEMFRFFTGRKPLTTKVLPQLGKIDVSGRVQFFVSNLPVDDGTLTVYRVNRLNGERVGKPVATFALTDGTFGPFRAQPLALYEMVLTRGEITHHFYTEPFRRTDRFVRLLTDQPGGIVRSIMTASPNHTNLTVSRNQEWYSDRGKGSDVLRIDGANVLEGIAPRDKRAIGIAIGDQQADRRSVLGQPIAEFASVPFITGVDHYLRSGKRLTGLRLHLKPRGAKLGRTLVMPAWPSSDHWVSVQFNAHH